MTDHEQTRKLVVEIIKATRASATRHRNAEGVSMETRDGWAYDLVACAFEDLADRMEAAAKNLGVSV